ncbi:MAG: hypothetical protein ABGZ53_25190 [Fuerstiella sp.]
MECLRQKSVPNESFPLEAGPIDDRAIVIMQEAADILCLEIRCAVHEVSTGGSLEKDDLRVITTDAEELVEWAQGVVHAAKALQSRLSLV